MNGAFATTQNSTFYSVNQSQEPADPFSPFGKGGYASDLNSPDVRTTPLRMRETQTPKLKGVPQQQLQKFKKAARVNNMKDIVFVYADLGPRQLR